MATKLATTVEKIGSLPNKENSNMIKRFHEFMKSNGASERHQNNNLKSVISFANFLGPDTTFTNVNNTNQILSFFNTKIKSPQDDPEKKWITTWNITFIE
jgi:integrase/recombinase XerD